MTPTRKHAAKGNAVVQMIGVLIIGLMFSAIGIDMGLYFGAQNQLQTAANAGALAAVQTLWNSSASTPSVRRTEAETAAADLVEDNFGGNNNVTLDSGDVVFGYVPLNSKVATSSFTTPASGGLYPETGGYNAVRVIVRRSDDSPSGPLTTIMANLFKVDSMNLRAAAVAMMSDNVSTLTSGVRPIYGCTAQYQNAIASGKKVRIYGQGFYIYTGQGSGSNTGGISVPAGWQAASNCPTPGSGNWGFADLRDCNAGSVGASTIGDWFKDGYPGTVKLGQCYSTKPGNFLASGPVSSALNTLIQNQTEVYIPIVPQNKFTGNGSNTQVTPSAFAGFVFTDYKATGSNSSRYIEGYYTKKICTNDCRDSDPTAAQGGVTKLRLIAAH